MKSVKWLYALFFALTFTLCSEMTGAFAVKGGLVWYETLSLPTFALPSAAHTAIWCVVYVLEAVVIAQLIVSNRIKPFVVCYLTIKLLSAIWTVSFFVGNLTFFALVLLTVIVLMNFYYFKELLHAPVHRLKALLFLPVLCWYCYLWILCYCVYLIN